MKIDEFLKIYPWPEGRAAGGQLLQALWEFKLDVRVSELWPWLVDTSRFNRALGLSKMEYEERDGRLHGSTVNAGFPQVWVEDPWQWVEGRSVVGGRVYSEGFANSVRVVYDLSSLDDGRSTCLRVYFGWDPRNWFGRKILKMSLPWLKKRYTEVLESIAADLASGRPAIYEQKLESLDEHVEGRIRAFSDRMMEQRLSSESVRCLLNFVRTADEMDAHRLRVHELALQKGVDSNSLTKACLHATRLGLLEMSWDVICPHCRGVRVATSSLNQVGANSSCEVCDIEFATDEENAVEITFRIHPSVREVPEVFYCAAEPAGKRHIKFQQGVAGGAGVVASPELSPGRYRLRLQGSEKYRMLEVTAELEPESVEWSGRDDGLVVSREGLDSRIRVGIGSSFRLSNQSKSEQTFVLEDAGWSDLALRPGELFNRHDFRDLFGEEFLKTGVKLSVGNQVLLFTDVVGSTRFYAESGDSKAYSEIKGHFDEVFPIIEKNRGAVVKTIGDAVMASFCDPVDALKASTEMHQCLHESREDLSVRIRISLNMGPCIAVNMNTGIDYFGTAVNLAAKLQAFAEAGDVAFSDNLMKDPGVQEHIASEGLQLEHLEFDSDAFSEPIPVHRWNVYAHGAGRRP